MCCAARSVERFCCGSREPAREGHCRGRRRIARQPGSRGLRGGGLVDRPQHGTGGEQAGDRARHQQRRRVPRADRGTRGGRQARRHRGRRVDGLQACGGTDVGPLEGQTSRHAPLASTGHRAVDPFRPHHLRVDPACQEQPCRPAGQRGDGRRRRNRDARPRRQDSRRHRHRPRGGRVPAVRRPGSCCFATGRPSYPRSGGIPAEATRR